MTLKKYLELQKYKQKKYSIDQLKNKCGEFGNMFGYIDIVESIDTIEKSKDLSNVYKELNKKKSTKDVLVTLLDNEIRIPVPNEENSWNINLDYIQKELLYMFDKKELEICKKSFIEEYPNGVIEYLLLKFPKIKN